VDESAVNPSDVYIPKVEHWAPFVLAGTKVIEGWAEMVVTAVGRRTLWMTTMDTVVVNDGLSPHFAKQRKVVQFRDFVLVFLLFVAC
jgi:magnesium-transporting ATPase (P-type)